MFSRVIRLSFVGAALATQTAAADTYEAVSTEASPKSAGDISSLDYWALYGKTALPGATDTVKLNIRATDPTFTCNSDLTVGQLLLSRSGAFLSIPQGVTLTVAQKSEGEGVKFTPEKSGNRISGPGTINFSNGAHFYCGAAFQQTVNLLDGLVVTNVDRFYGNYNRDVTTLNINRAYVHCNSFYGSYGKTVVNPRVTVTNGAQVLIANRLMTDDGSVENQSPDGASILVSGAGTRFIQTGSSTSYIGVKSNGNELRINDGALAVMAPIYLGYQQTSRANRYIVEGTGTTVTNGLLSIGFKADMASDNLFEVKDGASYYNTGIIYVGDAASGNAMHVDSAKSSSGNLYVGYGAGASNCTLTVAGATARVEMRSSTALHVGYEGSSNRCDVTGGQITFSSGTLGVKVGFAKTSSNNVFRLSGSAANLKLPTSTYDPFGAGSYNTFLVEDGATIDSCAFYFATNSAHNVARFDHATFKPATHGYLGFGSFEHVRDSRLEVVNGAELQFASFSLCGMRQTLLVSNATVSVADNSRGLRIGYSTDDATYTGSNRVEIAGRTARLNIEGPIACNHAARLAFVVPAEGYAQAPVMANSVSFSANDRILVDYEAFKNGEIGGDQILISTRDGFDAKRAESVLKASNALIPDYPRVALKYKEGADGRTNLVLHVPTRKGLILLVR